MKTAEAVIKEAEQIILPNRYQQPFIEAFQQMTGIEVPELTGRRLSVKSSGLVFRWLRGRDIPAVVDSLNQSSTVGLTGSEWFAEYRSSRSNIGISAVKLCEESMGRIALVDKASNDVGLTRARLLTGYRPLRVATAYPNLVRALGMSGQYSLAVGALVSGGVEGAADLLGMPGVDLVSSGQTLAENNFVVVENLQGVYPVVVSRRER